MFGSFARFNCESIVEKMQFNFKLSNIDIVENVDFKQTENENTQRSYEKLKLIYNIYPITIRCCIQWKC